MVADGQMGKGAKSADGEPLEDVTDELGALFDYYAAEGEAREYQPIQAKAFRGRAAWFEFPEICQRALGAGDYIALLEHADTLALEGVPRFGEHDSDAALRLVSLIDVCYEKRRRVVISAAAYPDELYLKGPVFEAFRRVASRLAEMQGWA